MIQAEFGVPASHVADLGMREATDAGIRDYSSAENVVVIRRTPISWICTGSAPLVVGSCGFASVTVGGMLC